MNPLRGRRETLNITLREIADRCGCTTAQVWNWEHDRSAPTRFDVATLAEAYELTPKQMRELLIELSGRVTRRRLERVA